MIQLQKKDINVIITNSKLYFLNSPLRLQYNLALEKCLVLRLLFVFIFKFIKHFLIVSETMLKPTFWAYIQSRRWNLCVINSFIKRNMQQVLRKMIHFLKTLMATDQKLFRKPHSDKVSLLITVAFFWDLRNWSKNHIIHCEKFRYTVRKIFQWV